MRKRLRIIAFISAVLMMCLASLPSCNGSGHKCERDMADSEILLKYMWEPANCQHPERCAYCGWIRNEEMGSHSTKLGKCNQCDEFQNKETYDKFKSTMEEACELFSDIMNINTINSRVEAAAAVEVIYNHYPELDQYKPLFEEIRDFCADGDEDPNLVFLKSDISFVLEWFPEKPSSDLPIDEYGEKCLEWTIGFCTFSDYVVEMYENYLNYVGDFE